MKKSVTIGIIVAAIVIGLGVGLSAGTMNSSELTDVDSIISEVENSETTGRNITIELTEGIPISATP